jgi:N-acyl-D-amino-acid deacylase
MAHRRARSNTLGLSMSYDRVIRNGIVFDGTGRDPQSADIAIADGMIVGFGQIASADCPEIDASGLYVAPGFIDIHSHSDYTLLVDPRAISALHQGVTLEVVGNCGHGCFPISDPIMARTAIYGHTGDVPLNWTTAADFFERVETNRPAVNVISLVPNGQLRLSTLGLADRPAESAELRMMTRLLEESLAAGAWGLSTGLEYATEAGAPENEVAELCRALSRSGGLYATHTRRRDEGAADAVREAIRVARNTEVRLQISHLLPRNGSEEGNRCLELVESAREEGLDVAFDMHTRRFGLTHLYAALPAEVLAARPAERVKLLRDPAVRARIESHDSILGTGRDWSHVVLIDNQVRPEYARRDIESISRERQQSVIDTVCDLLIESADDSQDLTVIIHSYTEEQQREVFAHPLCMPASDATTLAPEGSLAKSTFHGAYTWAAWFFRFMVREHQLLSPAAAINRLTGLPARRLGLSNRGVLKPGAYADLVVFAPDRYGERGTTFEPNQLADGVVHVLVNGIPALMNGVVTNERAGHVIRSR